MKRLQYDRHGGPEQMYVGDHRLPPVGPEQVRVAVRAAAVNPFDWKLRQGALRLLTGSRFPKGMGTDFAGVVEAVGKGVIDLRIGDEVVGSLDFRASGAFAEKVVVAAPLVARKPANLSFSQAACLPIPAMTAWAAIVDRIRARPGSRIFVNGCNSAVGAFAVQLARDHGASVGGACGPASIAGVKAAGVDPVFEYAARRTGARGLEFDAVFDCLGTMPVGEGLAMLTPRGMFIDINPTLPRVLRGMLSRRYRMVFATMGAKHIADIARLAGEDVLRPQIGLEAPFEDAVAVVAKAETGPRVPGRTVLTFAREASPG